MTDATNKRIAQWPTLRGATLVVSLQEPVPGERFVDIRRWHGEPGSDLVPGLQGITLAASELPDLRKALADIGFEPGPADTLPAAHAAPPPVEPPAAAPAATGPDAPASSAAEVPDPEPVVEVEAKVEAEAEADSPVPARAGRRGISRIWR